MSDENLSDVLDDKADYLAYMKNKTIEKLSERTHLTMAKIAKLVDHDKHGAVVGEITLQELIDYQVKVQLEDAVAEQLEQVEGLYSSDPPGDGDDVGVKVAKKRTKKKAKKPAKKKATSKKKEKKPAKKKAKKTTKKKRSAAVKKDGRKADYGKKKPRLKRDQGYKEILAALKAAGEPCGRKALETATGYTGVQVRTFCKELAAQGKVEVLGKGGRSTKYALS